MLSVGDRVFVAKGRHKNYCGIVRRIVEAAETVTGIAQYGVSLYEPIDSRILNTPVEKEGAIGWCQECELIPVADAGEMVPVYGKLYYEVDIFSASSPVLLTYAFVRWTFNPGATAATWVMRIGAEPEQLLDHLHGTDPARFFVSPEEAWGHYIADANGHVKYLESELARVTTEITKTHQRLNKAVHERATVNAQTTHI
jgi:hypothetical protein